jgi:two-component system sensor histidine kinase PilS (NtrC family)
MPEELRGRLKWLMVIRVVIVTVLLGIYLAIRIRSNLQGPTQPFLALIIATYLLTILYSLALRQEISVSHQAVLQIAVDQGLITGLAGLTGGIESPFLAFYMLSVVSASTLFGLRGGGLAASSSSILLGLITDVQYYNLWPTLAGTALQGWEVLYQLLLNFVAFFTVGILSGHLAQSLAATRRRLQEKSQGLAELQALYHQIIQSMGSGLMTTDLSGRIITMNRVAEQILGVSVQKALGCFWWEAFPADSVKVRWEKGGRSLPDRFEETVHPATGPARQVGFSLSPLCDEQGNETGQVWIFQDITRIREMEREIQRKQWLAGIGEMASGIAHEIRNPLASLSGSMQVLRQELRLDTEQKRLMEIALKETDRLNGIVTAFLMYARPMPLNRKSCDLHLLLNETLQLLKTNEVIRHGVEVVADWESRPLPILADPDRIKQVFWNLYLNACEAMPRGGRLRLCTRLIPNGNRQTVEVSVEDEGEGIPPEHLDKIFQPFFTTKDRGSGLGLALVHRVVEQHEGSVRVESAKGKGTRMVVRLPFHEEPAAF